MQTPQYISKASQLLDSGVCMHGGQLEAVQGRTC